MVTPKLHKSNLHWQELDVLRGLAAILMIVNHLGYTTLSPEQLGQNWLGTLVFVGSFAPVLFFFVTGMGYGIQSSQKKATRWSVTFNKVGVLVLADLLMSWSANLWLGLDFLGFIALSSLVLEVIRNSKAPLTYCIIGFFSISFLRYGVGLFLRPLGDGSLPLLGWLLGTSDSPGVSYPLSPWLAYPFLGYWLGVLIVRNRSWIESDRIRTIYSLFLLASLPGIIALFLARHGASFFRWGTVGLGFYIASFGVILMGLAIALAICVKSKLSPFRSAVALNGISSLAVVPIHYFLVYWVGLMGMSLNWMGFFLTAFMVVATSFLLSRFIENLGATLRRKQKQKLIWSGLVVVFLIAASVVLLFNQGRVAWLPVQENASLVMLTKTLGQLALCLLLVIRWTQTNKPTLVSS